MEVIAILLATKLIPNHMITTDCKSILSNLKSNLKKYTNQNYFTLLSFLQRSLKPEHLTWHRSHPEKSTPPHSWTQPEWGVYYADYYADDRYHQPHHNFHMNVYTVTTSQILQLFLYNNDHWTWCHSNHNPILYPIEHYIRQQAHHEYIFKRDLNPVQTSTIPWSQRHYTLPTKLIPKPSIEQQIQLTKLSYDLYDHGRNRAKSLKTTNICLLCHMPDSSNHILLHCTHPDMVVTRDQILRSSPNIKIHQTANHHPSSRPLNTYLYMDRRTHRPT
jgi:hypothetical protein